MIINTYSALLVAESPRWAQMSQRFKSEGPTEFPWELLGVLLTLGVTVAVALAAWRLLRQIRQHGYDSPALLFWQLCRAHRLSVRDSVRLYRLAIRQRLPQPASLFLRPELFDPRELKTRRPGEIMQLSRLRDKLFSS